MDTEQRFNRRDAALLAGVLVLSVAVRLLYVARLGVPPFDPWRHLLLIQAVRAGDGFTLFDGQPYLWYAPWWHTLVAALPARLGALGLATTLSAGVPCVLYGLTRLREGSRTAAAAAGCAGALLGPLVAYTCHLGPEAAALLLMAAAPLVAATTRGPAGAALGGLLAGASLVLRMNFLFDLALLAPFLRTRRRRLAALAGAVLPLAWLWWRNRAIIASHDWLFTWDGLAVRGSGFGVLGALLPQRHPDIAAGLARLHAMIVPLPEWIHGPDGWRPDLMLLVGVAVALVLASRRVDLIAATLAALAYFLLLDQTGSARFFRVYLPLMLPVVLALGAVVAGARTGPRRRTIAAATVALLGLAGARLLVPPPMVELAAVTPPPGLVSAGAFFVNSAYYHPESVLYANPDRRVLGLPLRADELDAFLAAYPDVDTVLWHEVSVQDEVLERFRLLGWREVARGRNGAGLTYRLLRRGA